MHHANEKLPSILNSQNNELMTPLFIAMNCNNATLVEKILQFNDFSLFGIVNNDLDFDLKGMDGKTALHQAVDQDQPNTVKILLEKSGKSLINEKDDGGETALMRAIQGSKKAIIDELLASNDLDFSTVNMKNQNLLHLAVKTNNTDVCQQMLRLCTQNI